MNNNRVHGFRDVAAKTLRYSFHEIREAGLMHKPGLFTVINLVSSVVAFFAFES